MAKTTCKIDDLTSNDMLNIYSAFETAECKTYILLRSRASGAHNISTWFKYLCEHVDLSKYIEKYRTLTTKTERDGFWLLYKK